MTFDVGAASDVKDDVLFIAHTGSGKISRTGMPSNVTNSPRGLAYDQGANELYILVDGKGQAPDHVVVVDPSTGAEIRDFAVPRGDAHSITFLGGSLYVMLRGEDQPGGPPRDIVVLSPTDGTEQRRFDIDNLPGSSHAGLSNDGTNLIIAPEFGGPHVEILNPQNGAKIDEVFFFDPSDIEGFDQEGFGALAFNTGTKEFFPVVVVFKEEASISLEGGNGVTFDSKTDSFTAPPTNTAPVVVVFKEEASISLEGGNGVTFDSETATFSALPTNTAPIVVVVEGEEISIAAGETTQPVAALLLEAPPEEGIGRIVAIIVGAVAIIGAAAAGTYIYVRRRGWPQPPPTPAGPPPEGAPPTDEEPGSPEEPPAELRKGHLKSLPPRPRRRRTS